MTCNVSSLFLMSLLIMLIIYWITLDPISFPTQNCWGTHNSGYTVRPTEDLACKKCLKQNAEGTTIPLINFNLSPPNFLGLKLFGSTWKTRSHSHLQFTGGKNTPGSINAVKPVRYYIINRYWFISWVPFLLIWPLVCPIGYVRCEFNVNYMQFA